MEINTANKSIHIFFLQLYKEITKTLNLSLKEYKTSRKQGPSE